MSDCKKSKKKENACNEVSAREALKRLKTGNRKGEIDRKVPKVGQCPFAIILSCADSRVIPEHLFSAKAGYIFVVRVAGNVVTSEIVASIEYAVANFNTKLIVVLGHEECGAVKEAISITKDPLGNPYTLSPDLDSLLARVRPAVVKVCDFEKEDKIIKTNAKLNAHLLAEQSTIIENTKGVRIVPAVANLQGKVTFYEEDAWPKVTDKS